MGHGRAKKHKHPHGPPLAHHTAHQEAIHKATLSYQLKPVADPEHPGQMIPLFDLEQRWRGRHYRQMTAGDPAADG